MTIWELSEKADYIASRHQRLLDQWQHYCNTLTQAITLSKAHLHHAVGCNPDDDLRFFLFDHFIVRIALGNGFNSHTISYYLESREGDDQALIAQAQMDDEGTVDGSVSNRARDQVLEHYLGLITPIYEQLYRAVHDDVPLNMALLCQQPTLSALA